MGALLTPIALMALLFAVTAFEEHLFPQVSVTEDAKSAAVEPERLGLLPEGPLLVDALTSVRAFYAQRMPMAASCSRRCGDIVAARERWLPIHAPSFSSRISWSSLLPLLPSLP
ncbi:hypothetical protein AQJ66_24695, partial [Streptomyces bungoensis]